jgi:hypothetical protein
MGSFKEIQPHLIKRLPYIYCWQWGSSQDRCSNITVYSTARNTKFRVQPKRLVAYQTLLKRSFSVSSVCSHSRTTREYFPKCAQKYLKTGIGGSMQHQQTGWKKEQKFLVGGHEEARQCVRHKRQSTVNVKLCMYVRLTTNRQWCCKSQSSYLGHWLVPGSCGCVYSVWKPCCKL